MSHGVNDMVEEAERIIVIQRHNEADDWMAVHFLALFNSE